PPIGPAPRASPAWSAASPPPPASGARTSSTASTSSAAPEPTAEVGCPLRGRSPMTRILALAVIASAGCGAKNATTITTHGVVVTIPHGDAIRVVSAADEAGFRYEEDDREIA